MNKLAISLVNEAVGLIANGIECWTKAGEIIVTLLDDGMTIQEISEKSEYLTEDIVRRFEQLGRKQIVPSLLVANYPAARNLVRLGYSDQKNATENGVELLVMNGNKAETLNVSVENLAPNQCRQVFNGNSIRSLAAQRAYIEAKMQEARISDPIDVVSEPYRISGKRVVFQRGCELTARQIAQILADIES